MIYLTDAFRCIITSDFNRYVFILVKVDSRYIGGEQFPEKKKSTWHVNGPDGYIKKTFIGLGMLIKNF